ncbi:hypothetical protein [Yoonia sediminilitoris]|uniref:Lipoprotein n=1 Tax=Yoonia sediminilitoris TaxID=1286148 RepID=A0A2T6KEW7_9RHOB|nr:hypothetical protein [Yoonia sediminilitoris]PUB13669.1 hypothetical protein C8N45_107129 [Yoonia sediminilitoris]RCW94839.1 hypothetical protein DFP92_107129 [Yoonia sediminilitoris]
MGESNKILSVTYGTFSCRLEGFDDSVETMKTVVSYFHELAGHDRFMDMDPQAPDLDELAEMTVEESGMAVTAKDVAGHVSLRVQRPEAETAEEAERPSLRIRHPDLAEQEEPDAAQADATAEDAHDVEDDRSDLDGFDDVSDLDELSEVDDLADLEALDDTAETALEEDAQDDAAVEVDAAHDSSDLNEEEADDVLAATTPENNEPVSHNEEELTSEDEEYEEDELASQEEDVAEAPEEEPAATENEPETADAPFYDPATATEDDSGDSVAAKLERIRALVGRVPPPNRPEPAKTVDPTEVGSIVDRLSALTGTSPEEDAQQTEDLVDDFDFKSDYSEPLVLSNESDAAGADDATDDASELEENAAHDADADAEDLESRMSDDDEDPSDDAAGEQKAEKPVARIREIHSKRYNLPEHDDSEMSRIMSQADERLNEPEGRRHRDAFAQLKAAVAATEAARQLGDQNTQADPRDAFREDLNEARRTTGEDESGDTAQQEASKDAAPLRLVAENRIAEEEEARPAAPADRLRQIASVKESGETTGEGFAEFAAAQGATELGDLLEAAAAYIAYVEGDDDFSRPQVMKKVQMAAAEQFSREDGLRSFGRLLRQSRIIKLNNGRFQVSEDTRFRPDGRAAQG